MRSQFQETSIEGILQAYLGTDDQTEADRLLEHLITGHALPLIRRIIRSELSTHPVQDWDDIASEVVVRLLKKLRLSKGNTDSPVWSSFSGYVAVTTYNACYQRLRDMYPERSRLNKRLRYILDRQPGFALWTAAGGERLCGFDLWRRQKRPACPRGRLHAIREDPQVEARAARAAGSTRGNVIVELLAVIFDSAGDPLRFDDLVDMAADLLRIKDVRAAEDKATDTHPVEASFVQEAEQRDYLRRLWAEIRSLPLDQRRALLLNLRDPEGENITPLIVQARIASIRGIAEAIELSAGDFAEMFGRLPLDDLAIGELIGASRQRVINLRKAARRRLSRRMRGLDWKQS